MNKDQVLGMIVGCAVGDAYGAPFEFMDPSDIEVPDGFSFGGAHNVDIGEYTDDTAMMMATAEAYASSGKLNLAKVVGNFQSWRDFGTFGTRDHVFDIGTTTLRSLNRMSRRHPFAGKAEENDSGNGSIMRIAPAVAANHRSLSRAVGDAVALSLMTHGNEDTIQYVSAFVPLLMSHSDYTGADFERWDIKTSKGTGTVMHTYNVAKSAMHYCSDFEEALNYALRLGYDTDTNCAVVGMLFGALYGLSAIPSKFTNRLMDYEYILETAEKLYGIGNQ